MGADVWRPTVKIQCLKTVHGAKPRSWARWHTPVIPAIRADSQEFKARVKYTVLEASLGYTRPCFKGPASEE